jgi:hypothetical protein
MIHDHLYTLLHLELIAAVYEEMSCWRFDDIHSKQHKPTCMQLAHNQIADWPDFIIINAPIFTVNRMLRHYDIQL